MIKPFRLSPVFKDYIWGGSKLKSAYFKDTPFNKTAESWELSCHKNGESTVVGGEFHGQTLSAVISEFQENGIDIVGKNAAQFDQFPVLIKLIDAKADLSVQVHPDDAYAMKHENGSYGKTEVWYVAEAEPGAKLVYGLNQDMTKEAFLAAVQNNTLTEYLNFVPAKPGDVFFVNSGTIHAIGAGLFICEIQQNSDTTYRVYDWGRTGSDGKPRELHVEKAAEVSCLAKEIKTDFTPKLLSQKNGVEIYEAASCKYFTAKKYTSHAEVTLKTTQNSFSSVTFLSGEGTIQAGGERFPFRKGDTFFFAAQEAEILVSGACAFLETTV